MSAPATRDACHPRTLGQHLGARLASLGVKRFFGVPGDYNLALLDELVKEDGLEACWTCNELNAGYAADGYARVKGLGCCVVTFTVGSLSAINAVAGAYAENLPIICVTGGPNTNDFDTTRIVHHSTGRRGDFMQELACFREVTCAQEVIRSLDEAHEQIDRALSAAVKHSKPAYICICCNLAALPHPSFAAAPLPYSISPRLSNPAALEAAADAAAQFLGAAAKPVLVAGALLRTAGAAREFMELVEASGYAFAYMPAAKGLLPEAHPQCLGTYWGVCSTPFCGEIVESADAQLFAGAVFNDCATVGYSLNLPPAKLVEAAPYRVAVAGGAGGRVYGCVRMDDFLSALAKRVARNPTSLEIHARMALPAPEPPASEPGAPLQTKVLYKHVQAALTPETIVVAETGDALFNCQKLRLPAGCGYEWSQQFGSIGWSVGAVLGAAAAGAGAGRRVLACIGDGSFQMTAQDVSTMLRYKLNPIIVLANNGGYTIEVEIHDGPYNVLHNWDYVGLVRALDNGRGDAFTARATTEAELAAALEEARGAAAGKLVFIEAVLHRDDCSRELLEWGALMVKANSRPPRAQ